MLNTVQPPPPPHLPASIPRKRGAQSGDEIAPTRSTNKSRPTAFDDLPNEIVLHIASHVFQAAVTDQRNDVSSFVCNSALQSTLEAELRANAVLREIHAARSFSQLGTALAKVPDVFPRYRQGCLIAAIRLLPKLGCGKKAPESLKAQLRSLMPPHDPWADRNAADTRDAVALAMAEAFRPAHHQFDGFMSLEKVLAWLGADAAVSPQLEAALMRWTFDHLDKFVTGADYQRRLGEQLVATAPEVLKPRLRKVFDIILEREEYKAKPSAQTMAHQMDYLDTARAAGDPDQRWLLRRLAKTWIRQTRSSFPCLQQYRAYFLQLPPEHQMLLVRCRRAPLAAHEIVPFMSGMVGRFPGVALLAALASYNVGNMTEDALAHCGRLVRDIVEAACHTPQQTAVLQAAMSGDNIRYMGLRPFFEQSLAQADPDHRLALSVRLGLENFGCGEYSAEMAEKRAPMSAQLNRLLNARQPMDPHTIRTLVELNVSWLGRGQQARLIEHIRNLPPDDGARHLTSLFSRMKYLRSVHDLPPIQVMIDACRNLPPERRAGPVSALLDLLDHPTFRACVPLLQGVRQLYHELPTALRPVFNPQHDRVLA